MKHYRFLFLILLGCLCFSLSVYGQENKEDFKWLFGDWHAQLKGYENTSIIRVRPDYYQVAWDGEIDNAEKEEYIIESDNLAGYTFNYLIPTEYASDDDRYNMGFRFDEDYIYADDGETFTKVTAYNEDDNVKSEDIDIKTDDIVIDNEADEPIQPIIALKTFWEKNSNLIKGVLLSVLLLLFLVWLIKYVKKAKGRKATEEYINERHEKSEAILSKKKWPWALIIILAIVAIVGFAAIKLFGDGMFGDNEQIISNEYQAFEQVDSKNIHLYGYIDVKGKERIKPRFLFAKDFADGIGIVKDTDNKWKCINKDGEVLFSSEYGEIIGCDGLRYAIKNDDGLYGFVDRDNNITVPFVIEMCPEKKDGVYWLNGTCLIGDYRSTAIIDTTGHMIQKQYGYETIIGQYDNNIYLRDRYGRVSVVNNGSYSKHPYETIIDWDYYSLICKLEKKDGNGRDLAAKSTRGDYILYEYNGSYHADTTKYSSLEALMGHGERYVGAIQTYPRTFQKEESNFRTIPYQEGNKYGLKSPNGNKLTEAISYSPIYLYRDRPAYDMQYSIIDGDINGKRTQYLVNEKGNKYFPPELFYLTHPNRAGVVVAEFFNYSESAFHNPLVTCIVNINKGVMIKYLEDREHIVAVSDDGMIRISRTYSTELNTYDYEYEVDAEGFEYHDEEALRKLGEAIGEDIREFQEMVKEHTKVSSEYNWLEGTWSMTERGTGHLVLFKFKVNGTDYGTYSLGSTISNDVEIGNWSISGNRIKLWDAGTQTTSYLIIEGESLKDVDGTILYKR